MIRTSPDFESLLRKTRVLPVVTIADIEIALDLAAALRDGGMPVLEVTLRTEAAIGAIQRITEDLPGVVVGAGTVRTASQLSDALEAGAEFIVSPGCTAELLEAAANSDAGFIPGAVTPSEVMRLQDAGLSLLKFFPAESSGGIQALRGLAAPFPDVTFCPTGGIDLVTARDYLALPNVVCVGGSWMVPNQLVARRAWNAIRSIAQTTRSELEHAHLEAKGRS